VVLGIDQFQEMFAVIQFRILYFLCILAGHVACMGQMRDTCKILVGKPEGMRPRGIPNCRCKENIRMDLREIRCEVVVWIHLAQDKGAMVSCCEHGRESSGSIKGG